ASSSALPDSSLGSTPHRTREPKPKASDVLKMEHVGSLLSDVVKSHELRNEIVEELILIGGGKVAQNWM
ncbi:MAG: hypothetical protein J2P37_20755, partial [Ktedonobacteraceae bacterium]|nr:hypothetical protein [Ktedonobacteraceae bacterium]